MTDNSYYKLSSSAAWHNFFHVKCECVAQSVMSIVHLRALLSSLSMLVDNFFFGFPVVEFIARGNWRRAAFSLHLLLNIMRRSRRNLDPSYLCVRLCVRPIFEIDSMGRARSGSVRPKVRAQLSFLVFVLNNQILLVIKGRILASRRVA